MKPKTPPALPEAVGDVTVTLQLCPKNSFPHLHTELGHGDYPFGKVRFIQHINGACFWMMLERPDGTRAMYQVNTEDLMNAVLNRVADIEQKRQNTPTKV